jgi:hypothetical protein
MLNGRVLLVVIALTMLVNGAFVKYAPQYIADQGINLDFM